MSESDKQIGPCLPPNFRINNHPEDEDDEEEEQTFGPTFPESVLKKDGSDKTKELISTNDDDSADDDAFGPALPPGFSGNQIGPSLPSGFNLEDEDDETFGPVPEGLEDKNHQYDASQRLLKQNVKNITKREKWMLEPGKALAKTLQTKSITQFSQKSSKKDGPLTENEKKELAAVADKDNKMKEFLEKYEKGNKRDVSLLDKHRNDLKKNKKLKPEKTERREFDREKDLFTRSIDNKKKNGFIKEASTTFPSRFSSGKFEKFL